MTQEAIVWTPPHQLLEQVERKEREARLRLDAAREQALMNKGEGSSEHHELIHKLEAEWKHALERLHLARCRGGLIASTFRILAWLPNPDRKGHSHSRATSLSDRATSSSESCDDAPSVRSGERVRR
jgi:hypothetical protein